MAAPKQRVARSSDIRSYVLPRMCSCHGSKHGCDECRKSAKGALRHSMSSTGLIDPVPGIVYDVLRSTGDPLTSETRRLFDERLHSDFSSVQVHTDSRAADSAAAISARAYTVGSHVVFARGTYQPGTSEGRRLLGHELTHVRQQRGRTATALRLGAANDHAELEAKTASLRADSERAAPRSSILSEEPGTLRRQLAEPEVEVEVEPYETNAPRYGTPPHSWRELEEAWRRQGETAELRARHEMPLATLVRGGAPPDFVTVEGTQEHMMDWGNVTTQMRVLHILDAIEYWAERARSEEDLEQVRSRFIPDLTPIRIRDPQPLLFVPIIPPQLDPQATARLTAFARGTERRRRRLQAAAPTTAATPEPARGRPERRTERSRRLRYPICWPVMLQPPRNSTFVRRRGAPRDDETREEARMALYWRQFRDPDFDAENWDVHHRDPLFLGGEDNLRPGGNGVILRKSQHRDGHAQLRIQPQMATPPIPLRPLSRDIYTHADGTEYELIGYKTSAESRCAAP